MVTSRHELPNANDASITSLSENSAQTPFRGVSRRSFIAGAAVLAAGGMLAGCTSQTGEDGGNGTASTTIEDGVYSGACRGGCAVHCLLNVHVRDGKVVRTSAADMSDTRYNRICSKGLMHPARVYSPKRLQYPMKRVGERGAGEFERISWDEALDEITEKWQGYVDEFGSQSIALATGAGTMGDLASSSFTMLKNILGLSGVNLCADLAMSYAGGHVTGTDLYDKQNEPAEWTKSKTFICWGADPTISTPQNVHFIWEARDAGAKYIVIDPLVNANAAKADWHIPIYPSTDGALGLGALNYLLEQEWQDEGFIKQHTEAPLYVVQETGKFLRMSDLGVEPTEGDIDPMTGEPTIIDPLVVWDEDTNAAVSLAETTNPSLQSRAEVEGIAVTLVYDMVKAVIAEYPLERTEQLTGVPVDSIKELVRVYVEDGPVDTLIMYGPDHYINGHYNYWPLYTLSAFTGNYCKEGATAGPSMDTGNYLLNAAIYNAPTDSEGNPAQGASPVLLTKSEIADVLKTNTQAGEPFTLKSLYIAGTNLAASSANHNETTGWLKDVEFIVVADLNMNETAMYADILLPVCHWFEQVDTCSGMGSTPFYLMQDKALEPQFESKSDYHIAKLICEKMGYPGFFDLSEEEWLAQLFNNETMQAMGISFERLQAEKSIKNISDGFIAFENGAFKTPTGKFSLYTEEPMPWYYIGQDMDFSKEMTLYWEPSRYADPASEARTGAYPYYVFSQHMRTRTHTQWWDVDYMDEYEPDPTVHINPQDAEELGIVEGDQVRLSNELGSVVLLAVIDAGAPPKSLFAGRSFNSFEFIDGHFASIMPSEYNQMIPNSPFNDVAATIEKA